MAGFLAVNGHIQVDNAAVPLGKPGHLHRRAVGDLFFQTQQHFLPHNLSAYLPVRLIRGHAIGEQLRPLLCIARKQSQQLLQSIPGPGGNGHNGGKPVVCFAVGGNHRQQVVLFGHGVNFVDAQNARQLLLLNTLQQNLLRLAHMSNRLHQQQRTLHICQAFPHHLHHIISQPGAGLVQAGGVQQHKLGVPPVHHAVNAVAGGLGLVGYDGNFLPHQSVGEAGLAHIGPSADGNHRGFCNVTHR